MTLYKILNQEAKSLWFHKLLRKHNSITARPREREFIKSGLKILRECWQNSGYALVLTDGNLWSIYYDDGGKSTGGGGLQSPMIQACIRIGIPVIDMTGVDDHFKVVSIPLVGLAPEKRAIRRSTGLPYLSNSYAPLDYVVEKYKEVGAKIYNEEYVYVREYVRSV